jgi:AAA family ATPase
MPPIITSLRLAIEAADEFITSREQRRAYISPDALRTYKVPAGSWVILDTGKRHAAVLQLWPRATADIEGMSTFSLSGRSEMISLAVPAGTDGNVDIHLFEPSSARIIKSIILSSSGSTEDLSGREKDWLISYLKEELGKSRGLGKD